MAEKKKQAPCSKWMHHKWLPSRKDLKVDESLCPTCGEERCECPPDGTTDQGFAKQTCVFCGDTRKIKIEINEELVEE